MGNPSEPRGLFQYLKLKKKKKKDPQKKTQRINTVQQLVCLLGFGEREGKKDSIQGRSWCVAPSFLRILSIIGCA